MLRFLSHSSWDVTSDLTVLDAVQRGQSGAFRLIEERHHPAVHAYASGCVWGAEEVEGLTTRAFGTALQARLAGGPTFGAHQLGCMRRELLNGVRNAAIARARHARSVLTPEFRSWMEKGGAWPLEEGAQLAMAFEYLPQLSQLLLWHGLVERDEPSLIARISGVPEPDIHGSTRRAKESLRAIRAELHTRCMGSRECCEAMPWLGTRTEGASVSGTTEHGSGCPWCREVYEDLTDLDSRLALYLPAWQLGWWPGPSYLRIKAVPEPPAGGPRAYRRLARTAGRAGGVPTVRAAVRRNSGAAR
ncbi:hypothetical protein [Streptomyces sp. NPDC058989]|uniref:hypothetical protein n=1 Tax=Streptomyces sp. NPDC058989 TaxID=3346686 RepID=UPI00367BA26C